MKAHLDALKARITLVGITPHIGQVPRGTTMPFASLSGPGWDSGDDLAICGPGAELVADVRVLVTHTTESNVYVALDKLREELTPNLDPTRLVVPGRYAVVEFLRSEFVMTDRDVTYGETNRHPGYGVDTYRITSHPAA